MRCAFVSGGRTCALPIFLLWCLLPCGILGIVIGALTFQFISEAMLRLMIGVLALTFTLNHWLHGRVRAPVKLSERASAWFWSGLSGFTSFLAHAGGPPMMIYLQIGRAHV